MKEAANRDCIIDKELERLTIKLRDLQIQRSVIDEHIVSITNQINYTVKSSNSVSTKTATTSSIVPDHNSIPKIVRTDKRNKYQPVSKDGVVLKVGDEVIVTTTTDKATKGDKGRIIGFESRRDGRYAEFVIYGVEDPVKRKCTNLIFESRP